MKKKLTDQLIRKLETAKGYRSLRIPAGIPAAKRRNARFPFIVATHITAMPLPEDGKPVPRLFYQDNPCAYWSCNNLSCAELRLLLAEA